MNIPKYVVVRVRYGPDEIDSLGIKITRPQALEDLLVKLTPEARLAWRLSGQPPTIRDCDDPRIAHVIYCRRDLTNWVDARNLWDKMQELNGAAVRTELLAASDPAWLLSTHEVVGPLNDKDFDRVLSSYSPDAFNLTLDPPLPAPAPHSAENPEPHACPPKRR